MVAALLALALVLLSTVPGWTTTAYAQADSNCRVAMRAGWAPYRVAPGDTLATLAAQAALTPVELSAANCLNRVDLAAGDLLLLPKNLTAAAAVPVDVPNIELIVAPTPSMPLTIISSTTPIVAPASATVTTGSRDSIIGAAITMANSVGIGANRGSGTLIMLMLLLFAAIGMAVYIVRPQRNKATAPADGFMLLTSSMGHIIALVVGFVAGLVIFLGLRSAGMAVLPGNLGIIYATVLLGLLGAKELFMSITSRPLAYRIFSLSLTPLVVLFFLSVTTQIIEVMR
jgi:hypothetical protein